MRTRSKRLSGLVAVAAASLLAVGACSSGGGAGGEGNVSAGFADCEKKPNECNSGQTKKGGQLTASLEKTIQNFNIIDSDGNTFETSQVMNGVVPSPFITRPDLKPTLNTDLMVSAEQTSTSPQTIVYKVKPEAVWSDGSAIGFEDFQFMWKVQNGKDCKDCTPASTTGYELISSMEQSDNGKTITVKFDKPYPDWRGLFSLFPASVAKQGGDLNTAAGLSKAYNSFKADAPKWSGAGYVISEYVKDQSVTLTPNPKWYGKDKPALDKIVFRMITDQAQQVPALQNREIQYMYSQPNVDMVNQVKNIQNVNYTIGKGLVWEHVDLNLKNQYLKDVALRQALFTVINTKEIINKTIGQFVPGAQPLGSHNFVPGQAGYKDFVTPTGQGSGDVEKAKKILTDAGYKIEGGKLITKAGTPVPALRMAHTEGNQVRAQTSALVQNAAKQIGVDITITPVKSLGGTLSKGDYDLIIFAWVSSPYNSGNKDLWSTPGGSNYGKWSNAEADKALEQAAQETDSAKVADLLNKADEIMTKEAYVLPLYQKPTFLAIYKDYVHIRDNPTNAGPTYNIEQWGMKASAQ
jgi:peptide/nickel transport system substrate-binding protein